MTCPLSRMASAGVCWVYVLTRQNILLVYSALVTPNAQRGLQTDGGDANLHNLSVRVCLRTQGRPWALRWCYAPMRPSTAALVECLLCMLVAHLVRI